MKLRKLTPAWMALLAAAAWADQRQPPTNPGSAGLPAGAVEPLPPLPPRMGDAEGGIPAGAAELPALPPALEADESPTHWACRLEGIASDHECTWEGDEGRPGKDLAAQARANIRAATDAAAKSCASASRGRADEAHEQEQIGLCRKMTAEAARRSCGLGGGTLEDARGNIPPGAHGCYSALAAAFRRARQMGLVSMGCCRCLADHRCGGGQAFVDRCNADLVELKPLARSIAACQARSCSNACPTAPVADASPRATLF